MSEDAGRTRKAAGHPAKKLLLGAGVAIGLLGAGELGLRLSDLPDPGLYEGDLSSVWTLRKNLPEREVPFPDEGRSFKVRTNSVGFRGPEAPEGAVVVLGCSTTFGWGVEEDESFPAQLAEQLGEPVVNGGVPGHSTAQGRATLETTMLLQPRLVVLAWLVRDAQKAQAPDDPSRVGPAGGGLHLMRLLRGAVRSPGAPTGGDQFRVSPEAYVANLQAIETALRLTGSEVFVLGFPMLEPPVEHLLALRKAWPDVLAPNLAANFYTRDRIHLNPAGNEELARIVAPRLPR